VIVLLATTAGLAVASNYYVQPLIPLIADDFGAAPATGGLLVTVSQAGYLAGLLLFLPLGDMVDRRRLAAGLMALTGLGLLAGAAAGGPLWLGACLLAFGATSVVTQVAVTIAADIAEPGRGGRTVGAVAGGALTGVLLARTVAGAVAEVAGWRGVYALAGVLVLATAALLWRRLPPLPPSHREGYRAQLRALLALVRGPAPLRRACVYGATTFAAFSVLWTTLAPMLAGPPYELSEGVIGLFGLAGAAGVLGARGGGRLFDAGHGTTVIVGATMLGVAAFGLIAAGRWSLAALLIGIVGIDLAGQLVQVTNQSTIFQLELPSGRLTSIYMASRFVGGAIGSALGAVLFGSLGWTASSLAGVGFYAIGLTVALANRRRAPAG